MPKHETLNDVDALRAWINESCDTSSRCVALIDPLRYPSPDACAQALGLTPEAFDALPNLYAKYAKSIRELGPRLWVGHPDDPAWGRLLGEVLDRQAASFLVVAPGALSAEEHLSGLIRMPQPNGGNLLFRFQDVVVLSALVPLLSGTQQRALLGPLRHWLVVDLCGHVIRIDASEASGRPVPALRLEQRQIDALGDALVPLTIIHQTNETDSTLLSGMSKCEQVRLIRARMLRAQAHGLRREDDIALYCVLSLQLPAGFDQAGPVADALQEARTRGIGFGDAIDEVPVERWREMDELLGADASPAGAH